VTALRPIDIIVISVIGVVVAISLIAFSLAPYKTEDSLVDNQGVSGNETTALVLASQPALFDSFGSPLSRVELGDQVLFQSEITNTQNKRQPFVYIVHVRDSHGVTVLLSYTKSELPANDTLKVAQSWIPAMLGKYDVQTFVWDTIDGQTVLSPTRTISVEVKS
jgi:hypothetical protein